MKSKHSAIIISVSSDIGAAMSRRWLAKGWKVFGTYRTKSLVTDELIREDAKLVYADLSDSKSIHDACINLKASCPKWDILIMCPGTQDPIGPFIDSNFEEWEESIKINFTSQLQIVHELLPFRNVEFILGPCVLFFSGGGTNNAPVNYSAYTISKIALIKMCELLEAEISDTRFVIVGPGWVKTKIHQATLKARLRAGANYQRTIEKLAGNECTSMKKVLDCCDWVIDLPRNLVGGRNFSVVFDMWGTKELEKKLAAESSLYKLRRFGNDALVRKSRRST